MQGNNIDTSRIKEKIVTGSNVVKAIMNEAQLGDYAVVAVGYSGTGKQGLMNQLTLGSASQKLCHNLQDRSLWIS